MAQKTFGFKPLLLIAMFVTTLFTVHAYGSVKAAPPVNKYQQQPQIMQWTIDGKIRQALVYIPAGAKSKLTPVIFAYHGHGGTMQNMYRSRGFEKLWPEAIFICPQGLPTVGLLTDPEGKRAGWEMRAADSVNSDLKFFDAMLKTLKADYKVDDKHIYITGHSNGGGFTYLLWAKRGDVFAACAPTSSTAAQYRRFLVPKPALHSVGENDPLVKPVMQKATIAYVKKLNQCESEGEKLDAYATLYKSTTGNPFIVYDHPGGHEYPLALNKIIIDFFKQQTKR